MKASCFIAALVLGLLAFESNASAETYAGPREVTKFRVRNNNTVEVGFDNQPGGTCSYYGFHMVLDVSTPAGKGMLSIVLAAKLAGKPVETWYEESAITGDQSSGCRPGNLAVLNSLGLR